MPFKIIFSRCLILACASLLPVVAPAQPPDAPFAPSQTVTREVASTVATFVEATQSDEGYGVARQLVSGASADARLARAWRMWRRAALTGNFDPQGNFSRSDEAILFNRRLVFRSVEVEEMHPGRDADVALQALVKVHLDIMTVLPDQPTDQWPAEPWQGEFTLQKRAAENARWQFAFARAPGVSDAFIPLSERGGNRLEQAVQVVSQPQNMLRTGRYLAFQGALHLVMDAVQLYVANTGHYPPVRYFGALLSVTPQSSRPALRRAFRVAGTTRTWKLNPALAARAVSETLSALPLFWDGTARHPYFSLAGHTVVAFADGRIELRDGPQ